MTPKAIANAAQALKESQEAREKIAAALASFTAAQDTTEAPARELDRLTREYEEMAAAALLGEIPAADADKAAKAMEAARKGLEAAQAAAHADTAAREGLARRLDRAEAAVNDARDALKMAEVEWLQSQVADADRAYTEAAQAAWQAWNRVFSCRAALTVRGNPVDGLNLRAPELHAAGPISAAAGHAAHPTEPHGWTREITPRHDEGASRMMVEAELSAMRETPPSLVSRAAAVLKKATA